MKTSPTISIGIPTYLAGKSLISTLESIYNQTQFYLVKEVIIVIDGKEKLDEAVAKKLTHPKLKIIFKDRREGQAAGINTLIKANTADLFILTNDDVVWDKKVVESFVSCYNKTNASLITAKVLPLKAKSMLEFIIGQSALIAERISQRWNHYENYLSCNGRLLLLDATLCRKMTIPRQLWNNDAYIYIFCAENGFKHSHQSEAMVKYRAPATLSEHQKQSTKFQFSKAENQHYFKRSIAHYYQIPTKYIVFSLIDLFRKDFRAFVSYMGLLTLTRFNSSNMLPRKHYWETDRSTKDI